MKHLLVLVLLLTISFNQLKAEEDSDSLSYQYQPGDHELLLMPTAYTMERGNAYFSDYELFFLNFSYGVTSSTHISTFMLFPITKHFTESFSIGIKQNYYKSNFFQGALFGSYTIKDKFYTAGNVFSIGRKSTSLHLGLALAGEASHGENILLILVGGRIDLSEKVTGIIEYTNAKELLDENFNGLLTFGIRFRGESTAWEIAGIRPLASTGDLLLLPLLKATICF